MEIEANGTGPHTDGFATVVAVNGFYVEDLSIWHLIKNPLSCSCLSC